MSLALAEAARSTNTVMEETSYKSLFSKIYDQALDILPYDEMADFLEKIFVKKDIKPSSLLDLGCGSGSLAILMAERGYELSGLDLSVDMLSVAHQKTFDKNLSIRYINQSMSEMELIDSYDVIYSFGDALNYLTDSKDLLSCFTGVYKYLNDDGYFIFDVNTADKFRSFGNNSFSESEDDFFYLWENEFDEEKNLNYYYVEIFAKEADSELYERSFETHCERAYELDFLKNSLKNSGFKNIEVYINMDFEEGSSSDDRFFFICKKG